MIHYVIGNIAFWWGILLLVLTGIRLILGDLTWRKYFIGVGIATFCSVMGLWSLGAF